MFVRLARNQEEQTLVAYQHCGEVYFTTVKVVKPTLLHLSFKWQFIDKDSERPTLLQMKDWLYSGNRCFRTHHLLYHLIHSKASSVWSFPVKGNVYICCGYWRTWVEKMQKYRSWWPCLNKTLWSVTIPVRNRHVVRLSCRITFDSASSWKVLFFIALSDTGCVLSALEDTE